MPPVWPTFQRADHKRGITLVDFFMTGRSSLLRVHISLMMQRFDDKTGARKEADKRKCPACFIRDNIHKGRPVNTK